MTFDADHETLPAMFEHIETLVSETAETTEGFDAIAYFINLACEEILVNIVNYAYPDSHGSVGVSWEHDASKKEVRIVFSDSGIPFNPLERATPSIDDPIEERQIGGLGIMMVKQKMDLVEYAHSDGKNILTIIKRY